MPFLLLLLACRESSECAPLEYPALTVSEAELSFTATVAGERSARTLIVSNEGGWPMGVASIGVGHSDDFDVAWDACAIECDGDAKAVDVDTGGADTGEAEAPPTPCAGPEGTLFVLDPGCQIAVTVGYDAFTPGGFQDAVVVESVGAPWPEPDSGDTGIELPAYMADPVHERRVTWLVGRAPEGETGGGFLAFDRQVLDFGFVYPGAADTGAIAVRNVGTASSEVMRFELDRCGAEWALAGGPAPGDTLAPGASVAATVTYTPTSTTPSTCTLRVSDGLYRDEAELRGNPASAPDTPPSVRITSPAPGAVVSRDGTLTIALEVSDPEQPPSSLTCRIDSAVLGAGTVATCTPPDDTGVFSVEVPGAALLQGADTLRVRVSDVQGRTGVAAVSVLVDATAADDADGDGFGAAVDCDDASVATWPEAAEAADGVDNDCDGMVDEGTTAFDDDGDAIAEDDGDCDDTTGAVWPGAPELPDGIDQDCDGEVDEGTNAGDDDGDGVTEVDNDCDDADATVHPGALEACDGWDNDCDGLRDAADGCVTADHVYAVGGIVMSDRTGVVSGETITLEARIVTADPDGVVYTWSGSSPGSGAAPDWTGPRLTWTAPAVDSARNENIYLVVSDATGTDWGFGTVSVYPEGTELETPCVPPPEGKGCGAGGGALLALVGLLSRRRRG